MLECSPAELKFNFNTLSCKSSSQTPNHSFNAHPVSNVVVLDTEVVLENLNTETDVIRYNNNKTKKDKLNNKKSKIKQNLLRWSQGSHTFDSMNCNECNFHVYSFLDKYFKETFIFRLIHY